MREAEDAGRVVVADVALEAAGPRRDADQAERLARRRCDTVPVSSKRAWTEARVPQQLDRGAHVRRGGVEALEPSVDARASSTSKRDAARAHQAAPEAVAADRARSG